MYDSVFDSFLQYFSDKLILGEKQVIGDLDELELKSAALIKSIPLDAAKKLDKSIDTVKRNLFQRISLALYSTWLLGWQLGEKHSQEEIEKTRFRVAKFTRFSNVIQFNDGTKRKGVRVQSIRNIPAENAIRGRINQLANDVTNSEFDRIREHLLAAVTPQPETGEPISRKELIDRIEETLGTKSGRFARRAETIARTELTFAYNAGRLDTYRQSGLVSHVCFYTIIDERRCPICASRQGLVIPLDDWRAIAQNSPPLHPRCRCILSPAVKDDPKLQDPNRSLDKKELVPRASPWAAAGILAAVLLGGRRVGRTAPVTAMTLATNQIREAIGERQKAQSRGQKEEQQPQTQAIVGSIDLNIATREELQNLLPGRSLNVRQVNEIIKRREQQPFTSVDELKSIPGIGVKTFERLKQLAEGNAIILLLDPQNIRTPAQLWASNVGLTKSQANTIFKEVQKGTFKDIEDLKQRLKGQGISEQTIKNMQERAAIIQRRLEKQLQRKQQALGDTSKQLKPTTDEIQES